MPLIVPPPADLYPDAYAIGFNDHCGAATFSGGSWEATLSAANLGDPRLSKVARSTDCDLASTQFDIDLGAVQTVRSNNLITHNLSLDAYARIRWFSDAARLVEVYSSGWREVFPPVYQTEDLEWEAPNFWDCKFTEEERAGINAVHAVFAPYSTAARYGRVEINDQDNAAGFVQIGRFFAGEGFQARVSARWGAGLGVDDEGERIASLSGAEYDLGGPTRRRIGCDLGPMPTGDARRLFEIQRRKGRARDIVVHWDPTDPGLSLQRTFLARFERQNLISNPYPDLHTSSLVAREEL